MLRYHENPKVLSKVSEVQIWAILVIAKKSVCNNSDSFSVPPDSYLTICIVNNSSILFNSIQDPLISIAVAMAVLRTVSLKYPMSSKFVFSPVIQKLTEPV